MQQPSSLHKRHRFPGELISHPVWPYYRFLLSDRDVEELLAERGSPSAMRPSAAGAGSSGRRSPTGCVGAVPGRATHGTERMGLPVGVGMTPSGIGSRRRSGCPVHDLSARPHRPRSVAAPLA